MTRRGIKTSEFWLVGAVALTLLAGGIADYFPSGYSAIGAGIASAAYAIARGMAKQAGIDAISSVIRLLEEDATEQDAS